jgi:hypothetical protein
MPPCSTADPCTTARCEGTRRGGAGVADRRGRRPLHRVADPAMWTAYSPTGIDHEAQRGFATFAPVCAHRFGAEIETLESYAHI